MPASALPLLQRLAAGDIFWVDQKNAEAQAVLKNGHAYIAATLPMRPAMSPVLITLVPTEEGIEASEKQRAFFRDLDDAEVAKDVQATREAAQRRLYVLGRLGVVQVPEEGELRTGNP